MNDDERGYQAILRKEKSGHLAECLPPLLLNVTINDFKGKWYFPADDQGSSIDIDDDIIRIDNDVEYYTFINGSLVLKDEESEESKVIFRLHQDGRMSVGNNEAILFFGRERSLPPDNGAARQVKITHNSSVNVRKQASSDSEKVGTAKSGGVYQHLDTAANGWYKIRLENGKEGWVSGKMAVLVNAP